MQCAVSTSHVALSTQTVFKALDTPPQKPRDVSPTTTTRHRLVPDTWTRLPLEVGQKASSRIGSWLTYLCVVLDSEVEFVVVSAAEAALLPIVPLYYHLTTTLQPCYGSQRAFTAILIAPLPVRTADNTQTQRGLHPCCVQRLGNSRGKPPLYMGAYCPQQKLLKSMKKYYIYTTLISLYSEGTFIKTAQHSRHLVDLAIHPAGGT